MGLGLDLVILRRAVRSHLTTKLTLEEIPEGRKVVPGRGTHKCKGPEAGARGRGEEERAEGDLR